MLEIVSRIWPASQRGSVLQRCQKFLLWHVRQVRERSIDLLRNVDTFGPARQETQNGVWPYAYDTAPWSAPLRILRRLHLDVARFTFIDMGSGKCRVVLAAATLPFAGVIGVEFSPPLCRIAERNLRTCRYLRQRADQISIIEGDAGEFQVPATPCVYYFYNPFSLNLMTSVIQKILCSYRQNPRDIYLICIGMSTVISDIKKIDGLKLRHSFALATDFLNKRSVFIFAVSNSHEPDTK